MGVTRRAFRQLDNALQALRLVETQPAVLLPPAVVRLLTDPSFLQTWGVRRPRLNSTSAWRHVVTICSVLYRLRGILPPARCARMLTLGLEPFQGARSSHSPTWQNRSCTSSVYNS